MSKRDLLPYEIAPEVRDACFCLTVQSAARALARRYDDALRPVGLTNGQFSLMMALNRPEPATIRAIAELLGMDRTTLTANLKPLERRRLVKVTIDAADRRSRRMILTRAGRVLLVEAMPIWHRMQAATERRIAPSSADRLRADLRALAEDQNPWPHRQRGVSGQDAHR